MYMTLKQTLGVANLLCRYLITQNQFGYSLVTNIFICLTILSLFFVNIVIAIASQSMNLFSNASLYFLLHSFQCFSTFFVMKISGLSLPNQLHPIKIGNWCNCSLRKFYVACFISKCKMVINIIISRKLNTNYRLNYRFFFSNSGYRPIIHKT